MKRRSFAAGALGLAAVPSVASAALACRLVPEQEEGPYYIPRERVRSAIAEGEAGVALALRIRLVDARSCAPVAGYAVDVWHCNASGVYSGYAAAPNGAGGVGPGPGGPPPNGPPPVGPPPGGPPPGARPPKPPPSDARTFLRGIQVTDSGGGAAFATIFPGVYPGRVNHVHLKAYPAAAIGERATARIVHTGQIFFDEDVARAISSGAPYAPRRFERTTLAEDGVYGGQNGAASTAVLERTPAGGYVATIALAVDPSLARHA